MSDSLNRAFLYGESVFTTILMLNSKLHHWEDHFERLKKGIEFVYGPFPSEPDWGIKLKKKIEIQCQDIQGDRIVRISVFQKLPSHERLPLKRTQLNFSELSLKIHFFNYEFYPEKKRSFRTCPGLDRSCWWPSFLKSGNYLDTILRQKHYLQSDDDDVIFLSPENLVLESSVANIFMVKDHWLYTPPSGSNVLEGVMRKKVLEVASEIFEGAMERKITRDDLLNSDGAFGSNSISGLFLLNVIDDREFHFSVDFLKRFRNLQKRVFYE